MFHNKNSGKGFRNTCLHRGSWLCGKEYVKFQNKKNKIKLKDNTVKKKKRKKVTRMDIEKQISTLMRPIIAFTTMGSHFHLTFVWIRFSSEIVAGKG